MRGTLRRCTAGLVLASLLLVTGLASASHDTAVEIQFWAFSRDSKYMLVVIKDEARGDRLAIKQLARQASIYEMALPEGIQPAQLPAYLQYPPFNAYGFVDPGTVGEASADGFTLMTATVGGQLQFMMSQGEKMARMFAMPLAVSPTGQGVAQARLKEVRWASTGKAVAIIVHQSLEASYGLKTDQLISFDPTTYKAKVATPAAAAPAGGARR